jgi:hypothetical protein
MACFWKLQLGRGMSVPSYTRYRLMISITVVPMGELELPFQRDPKLTFSERECDSSPR